MAVAAWWRQLRCDGCNGEDISVAMAIELHWRRWIRDGGNGSAAVTFKRRIYGGGDNSAAAAGIAAAAVVVARWSGGVWHFW